MNLKSLFRKAGGFLLGILMMAGMGWSSSAPVQAQSRHGRRVIIVRPYRVYRPYGWGWRRPWGWDNNFYYSQYVFDNSEKALNQGYHDGVKTGRDDGKKHKSYSPERSHYFHDAGFGNYAEAYRDGFARGYRDGYSQLG